MGGYHDDRDFDQLELSAYQRLYLNGGPFPTADGQVGDRRRDRASAGAPSSTGPTACAPTTGSAGNGRASIGLEGLDGPEFDAHLDAVWERLGSTATARISPGRTERLREATEKLGYDFQPITRNADRDLYDPASAAYMGFGDPSGSKLSTAKTYLADAQRDGARILSNCRVERILVEDGRAAGVEAVYDRSRGQPTAARRRG